MKLICSISITTFLSIFIITALTTPVAFASHNICWIKAANDDVFVRVFDKDRDGNTINDGNFYRKYFWGEKELWEGKLKRGQRKWIKSSNGQIGYDYMAASADRSYGRNTASCSHGEIIRIP